VHSIGLWHGVLAFGVGLMLGLSLDGVPAPAPDEEAAPMYERGAPAADEPVAAERRYAPRREPAPPAATPTEESTQTQTRTRVPSR
jgi:hypothetical protein